MRWWRSRRWSYPIGPKLMRWLVRGWISREGKYRNCRLLFGLVNTLRSKRRQSLSCVEMQLRQCLGWSLMSGRRGWEDFTKTSAETKRPYRLDVLSTKEVPALTRLWRLGIDGPRWGFNPNPHDLWKSPHMGLRNGNPLSAITIAAGGCEIGNWWPAALVKPP